MHTFCNKKLNSFADVKGELNLTIDSGFGKDFMEPRGIKTTRIMDASEKVKCSEVLGAGPVEMLERSDARDLYFNVTNQF